MITFFVDARIFYLDRTTAFYEAMNARTECNGKDKRYIGTSGIDLIGFAVELRGNTSTRPGILALSDRHPPLCYSSTVQDCTPPLAQYPGLII
jgi:hypothetical protein